MYLDSDDEQAALMLMLTRDSSTIALWEGKVTNHKGHVMVQVRKNLNGVSILINIGYKQEMGYRLHPMSKDRDVAISANGKANYTIDEITELNLVVKEAYGVYTNLQAIKE